MLKRLSVDGAARARDISMGILVIRVMALMRSIVCRPCVTRSRGDHVVETYMRLHLLISVVDNVSDILFVSIQRSKTCQRVVHVGVTGRGGRTADR